MIRTAIAALALLLAHAATAQTIPARATWYWQLSGTVNTTHTSAKVYDIDGQEATAALVTKLHGLGHTVVGYFSAGTAEPGRPDYAQFPTRCIGRKLSGWSEYYVDIRCPEVRTIMAARMAMIRGKGFDAVEPDVLDAFENPAGFPITKADEIDYIKWLAAEAHAQGMLIALKNDPEIVRELVNVVDFSIAEECFKYSECASYSPFVAAGKAVLAAEYGQYSASKCAKAKALGFSFGNPLIPREVNQWREDLIAIQSKGLIV